MKNEETITYAENGDNYLGVMPYSEAKKTLREMGYDFVYVGRKFSSAGMKTIVGINEHNQIFCDDRRKNGLWHATPKYI